jgi:PilZ domain-containing protein
VETTFQKQRKYPRHKAPKGMSVGWKSAGQRGVARAEVVGLGGLFLATPNPLPLGTVFELLFDLKTGEVRARAVVRDSVPGKGMGVQFLQMQPADRARLNQFLSQYASAEAEPIHK